MRDHDRVTVAAYVEMAVRAAQDGDGAALASALLSIPPEHRSAVDDAINQMCDTSRPLGALLHAATTTRR
jgi:hypothetical protein